MRTIIEQMKADDNWAQVELYRWQHGGLPGRRGDPPDDDEPEKPFDPSIGLERMADALWKAVEANDMDAAPSPSNLVSVMYYVARQMRKDAKLLADVEEER